MKSLTRLLLALCFLGTFFSGMAVADTSRPEVAKKVQAYEGTEGVKVWTLRVGPRSAKEAIVQIGGVDHEWDMKIMKARVEETAQGRNYMVQVGGESFLLLTLENGGGPLYLPGETKPRNVRYSEHLSEEGSPVDFLAEYLQQK